MTSEERLIPLIRARLAEKFTRDGLRSNEIAKALNVTQSAVTQYLKGKRGKSFESLRYIEEIVDPLAEKIEKRISSDQRGLEFIELLETARQLLVVNKNGRRPQQQIVPQRLEEESESQGGDKAAIKLLQDRLQLELKAAEKYLELANKSSDEHTKLLLRLIASDSIRHGDIVSQIVSWLELQGSAATKFEPPRPEILQQMIALEDSAKEVNLEKSVPTSHPIARLLLEWIDADEEKHEKIVKKVLQLAEV